MWTPKPFAIYRFQVYHWLTIKAMMWSSNSDPPHLPSEEDLWRRRCQGLGFASSLRPQWRDDQHHRDQNVFFAVTCTYVKLRCNIWRCFFIQQICRVKLLESIVIIRIIILASTLCPNVLFGLKTDVFWSKVEALFHISFHASRYRVVECANQQPFCR